VRYEKGAEKHNARIFSPGIVFIKSPIQQNKKIIPTSLKKKNFYGLKLPKNTARWHMNLVKRGEIMRLTVGFLAVDSNLSYNNSNKKLNKLDVIEGTCQPTFH